MDIWNWLNNCYDEKSLTLEDLEKVMSDDSAARVLWDDWASDSSDFIDYIRDEVDTFIIYLK